MKFPIFQQNSISVKKEFIRNSDYPLTLHRITPGADTGTGLAAMLTGTGLLTEQHRHRMSFDLPFTTDAWQ
jgi:hypothetical protein